MSNSEQNESGKSAKSISEWRSLLSKEQYEVLFEEATERPFTHELNDEKRSGTFVCAACHLPLFESEAKFDSGTGWPSFYQPIEGNLEVKTDFKLLLPRTEYHCVLLRLRPQAAPCCSPR